MLTYFAHQAHDGAWHVAYQRWNGQIVSMLDCTEEKTAREQADRINNENRAAAERAARAWAERRVPAGFYTGQGDT